MSRQREDSDRDIILAQIEGVIIEQNRQGKDKLPSERELAAMLNAGRPRIREALKRLESIGVVEIVHGSGVYIRKPAIRADSFPFTLMIDGSHDIEKVVSDLVETRTMLDCKIAQLVCDNASEEQLDDIEAYLERERRGTYESLIYTNVFEHMLSDIAGNSFLISLQKLVYEMWHTVIRRYGAEVTDVAVINSDHRQILEAIRTRDKDKVADAVTRHVFLPMKKVGNVKGFN